MTIKRWASPRIGTTNHILLLFEEFCAFIRTPQRTVREWRRLKRRLRWWRFNGNGRHDNDRRRAAASSRLVSDMAATPLDLPQSDPGG